MLFRSEERSIIEQTQRGFNQRWPAEYAITVGDFLKAKERYRKQSREMEQHPELGGLTLTRREKTLVDRHSAYLT